jgi:hypothetical protein
MKRRKRLTAVKEAGDSRHNGWLFSIPTVGVALYVLAFGVGVTWPMAIVFCAALVFAYVMHTGQPMDILLQAIAKLAVNVWQLKNKTK